MTRRYGWKQTHADGMTRHDFVWPLTVVAEARSDHDPVDGNHVCPRRPGDGLSVGLTARGVAQGGIRSQTLLIVSWDDDDTAAADADKVRVLGPVRVEAVLDRDRMLRQHGAYADLAYANLARADLTGANLTYANLTDANLARTSLTGAGLTGANLTGANLTDADLTGANLARADLGGWERGLDGYARRKVRR